MNPLETQLKAYLLETLQLQVKCRPHTSMKTWPLLLRSSYDAVEAEILDKPFLLVFGKSHELTPSMVEKQLNWIQELSGLIGIYVAEALTTYNRKRLIERKIPFIVPGNQMYLPDVGVDFREHLRKPKPQTETLSPTAQVLLLNVLLRSETCPEPFTATTLTQSLGYSKMAMSRALDELDTLGLIERARDGRQKLARFVSRGHSLWKQAKPVLRSPVKRRVYLSEVFQGLGPLAGECALAERSMLAPPRHEIRAVSEKTWIKKQSQLAPAILTEPDRHSATLELEIWSYPPERLGSEALVDPLSMVLSLLDETDERVEAALQEVEEAFPW